jgi:hypothetical protein
MVTLPRTTLRVAATIDRGVDFLFRRAIGPLDSPNLDLKLGR